MKSLGLGLLVALLFAAGEGCKKSPSEAGNPRSPTNGQPSTLNSQSPPPLARVHWLGKKQIAAQKAAAYLMSIWNMPEAARLESQTLDKLALALTGEQPAISTAQPAVASNHVAAASSQSPITNQPPTSQMLLANHPLAAKLRPLLDDLVPQEWYLEAQQADHQPAELVLAILLDDQRAELWTSNLTAVLGAATNAQSLPAPANCQSWRLPPASRFARLDLARAGQWTLLGLTASSQTPVAADGSRRTPPQSAPLAPTPVGGYTLETNALLAELSHRISLDHTPVHPPATNSSFKMDQLPRKVSPAPGSPPSTNDWLEAELDLRRLSGAFSLGWNLPITWPWIAATWTGTGEFVRTTCEMTFSTPLNLQLEPWNIPTNLIRQPLVSFTAVRGLRPWLTGQKWLQKLQIQPVPDQFCAWASGPTPLLTFAAPPMTNATALLQKAGPRIVTELNPWVTTNAFGVVEFSKEPANLAWSGIPMFSPDIETIATPSGTFLLGRVGPEPPSNSKPAPADLFAQLTTRPGLVYYDWEITQVMLAHWVYLSQTARLAFVLPQMPPDSAAFAFLLAAAPKLGNAGTEVAQDGPNSLSLVRNSTLGFTGVELHLLADWLESPTFPRGFHSLLAPKPPKWLPRSRSTNNAITIVRPPARHQTNPPARLR